MDSGLTSGVRHPGLAAGRWHTLSLAEQMGNIGSEVGRDRRWRGREKGRFAAAAVRALELLELTIRDPRWRRRLKELTRVKEIFCDELWGSRVYQTNLEAL